MKAMRGAWRRAINSEASAMPTTGTAQSSRAASRPGSPKQAMTTPSIPAPCSASASSTEWPAIAAAARLAM